MWFKVDDKLHSHTKTLRAGNEAMGLWVRLGSWSSDHLTDGEIPPEVISLFDPSGVATGALESSGWLEKTRHGWKLNNYLEFQPSRKEVKSLSKKRARAGQKGGSKTQAKPKQNPSNIESKSEAKGSGSGINTKKRGAESGPAKPRRRAPETAIPDGWSPTVEHAQRAHSDGTNLETEAAKFKHHATENDRRARSWNAAFSRWLINAKEYATIRERRRGSTSEKSHDQEELQRALDEKFPRVSGAA